MITTTDLKIRDKIKFREIKKNHLAIIKKRKSRIIKKDALKIIEIADKIKKTSQYQKVSLICRDNICSKSRKILKEAKIDVIIEE